ncbi:glycosyltransferase family 49 protein [Paxillus rubicundulus Ve08.2h10]|uniref:Glycosyltransferase family 49 protein n=1 Tax=Paxillus rubicundulus Ve08.2h10 TaxID=930991 RepID=A0A0D0E1Z1_9AGAM|nr:glycosyltransferase family 49 protein [Paxillus rubicundulus Ve08.2h10]
MLTGRFIHFFATVFVASAIVYSTCSLLMVPALKMRQSFDTVPAQTGGSTKYIEPKHKAPVKLPGEALYWPTGLGSQKFIMGENIFLSKAFSQSMQPCRIIPFYYKASATFEEDDITVTTLVTSNRFQVFAELVKRYRGTDPSLESHQYRTVGAGPISAAIHVKPNASRIVLDALHELYISTPGMSTFVDVHLVLSPFDRQLNTWRNAARLFARTAFVMMLDVDFAICTDFRRHIRAGLGTEVGQSLRDGHAALVVPAFEYVKQQDGINASMFPNDKKSLLELVKAEKIDMFHKSWAPGHNSGDYPRFYAAAPGEVYKIKRYQSAYEPYVIFRKEGPPWCDERFVGYGGNKAACLYEMYLSGMSFYVMADHFLVHQSHVYEEAARRLERKNNRKIYQEFKEEACLRYIRQHHDAGTLNTTLGYNVQEECKKIKGVPRAFIHIIEGKL